MCFRPLDIATLQFHQAGAGEDRPRQPPFPWPIIIPTSTMSFQKLCDLPLDKTFCNLYSRLVIIPA